MIFSFVSSRSRHILTIQKIIAATRHQIENDHDVILIMPVAIPSGIPIIKPKPIKKEGAIAISGLLAMENKTVNAVSAMKSSGLITKLIKIEGSGKIGFFIAGMIAKKLIDNKIIRDEITDIIYAGKKIAILLANHSSVGLNGVASSD
jgi:hypothetical protein